MVCVIQKILIGKMHQIGSKSALFAICRGFAARGVMSMCGRLESTNICACLLKRGLSTNGGCLQKGAVW